MYPKLKSFSGLSVAAAALMVSALPLLATVVLYVPLEEQAKTAEIIVVAAAGQGQSNWDAGGQLIFTDTRFEVQETVKGTVTGGVTTRQIGGTVGHIAQSVSGSPQFVSGRSYVLFLEPRPDGYYRVVGFNQGCYPVLTGRDGKRKVSPSLAGAEGVKLLGAAGAAAALPEPLADFLARVRACLKP